MKTFILMHESKYGVHTEIFHCDSTLKQLRKSVSKVCEALEIEFEPEKSETVTIEEIKEIKTITL